MKLFRGPEFPGWKRVQCSKGCRKMDEVEEGSLTERLEAAASSRRAVTPCGYSRTVTSAQLSCEKAPKAAGHREV